MYMYNGPKHLFLSYHQQQRFIRPTAVHGSRLRRGVLGHNPQCGLRTYRHRDSKRRAVNRRTTYWTTIALLRLYMLPPLPSNRRYDVELRKPTNYAIQHLTFFYIYIFYILSNRELKIIVV